MTIKKLIIPKMSVDVLDIEAVAEKLSNIVSNKIDTVNWPEEYPSKPDVAFRIAHNGDNILLQYEVHENEILAEVKEDNGAVWADSCVEFFMAVSPNQYYNTEATCIGKALMGHREVGHKTIHGSPEVMNSIKRLSTLGTGNIAKTQGDFCWMVTIIIPRTAYWEDDIASFNGMKARGNFYKCGDNLTVPHFLSWAKVDTPSPSFHQIGYFGELEFE